MSFSIHFFHFLREQLKCRRKSRLFFLMAVSGISFSPSNNSCRKCFHGQGCSLYYKLSWRLTKTISAIVSQSAFPDPVCQNQNQGGSWVWTSHGLPFPAHIENFSHMNRIKFFSPKSIKEIYLFSVLNSRMSYNT